MSPSYDIGKVQFFLLLDETFSGRRRTRRRGVLRPLTGHLTVPRVRGTDNIIHTEHIWPFWSLSGPSGHIQIVNLSKLRFKNGLSCTGWDLAVCANCFNSITRPFRGVWRCHTCTPNTGDVHSTANCSDSTVWSHTIVFCVRDRLHVCEKSNFFRFRTLSMKNVCMARSEQLTTEKVPINFQHNPRIHHNARIHHNHKINDWHTAEI